MSQESVRKRLATRVCWWIASTDELDSLEGDPGLVAGPVEAVVFDKLTEEGDDTLKSDKIRTFDTM